MEVDVKDAEQVYFTRDGEVLEGTERVTITSKDNVHKLEISKVERADEGEYTVICENQYGHITSTANLAVSG